MIPIFRTVCAVRLLALVLIAGCGDVEPYAPHSIIKDPEQLYMRLALNHRAINLSTASPYDTVRILAVPRDANGNPMPGMPAPTYTSSDTAAVSITADGLLRAKLPRSQVRVVAELAIEGNVRHADTAWVKVTNNANPPQLTTFSIDPVPPDSAVWAAATIEGGMAMGLLSFAGVDLTPQIKVRALDANNRPITGLIIEYESLTPNVAEVDRRSGAVSLPRPGRAIIVVRTSVYGIARADTTEYTVTVPVVQGVFLQDFENSEMRPTEVTVRPGGWVFWILISEDQKGVIFDDPSKALAVQPVCDAFGGPFCDSGNIPPFGSASNPFDSIRGRQFLEPGVYGFRSTDGTIGRIIVSDTLQ